LATASNVTRGDATWDGFVLGPASFTKLVYEGV